MRHRMTPFCARHVLNGLPVWIAVTTVSPDSQTLPAPGAGGGPDSLVCTLQSIDKGSGALDVLTGVGHAVRLVRMQVAPSCEISEAGVAVSLDELAPGTIIHLVYRYPRQGPAPPGEMVVLSIDILPPEGKAECR